MTDIEFVKQLIQTIYADNRDTTNLDRVATIIIERITESARRQIGKEIQNQFDRIKSKGYRFS